MSVASESLEALAADLTGSLLTEVAYYQLQYVDAEWDRGQYHAGLEGVELACSDGRRFLVRWGETFGEFDVELRPMPPGEAAPWIVRHDVTSHPWWTPFATSALTAKVIWRTGYCNRTEQDPDIPAPLAVSLATGAHLVWIVAAEKSANQGLWLGANEVLVTADPQFASSIGLRGKRNR